jgi:hypothetical protein
MYYFVLAKQAISYVKPRFTLNHVKRTWQNANAAQANAYSSNLQSFKKYLIMQGLFKNKPSS